MSDKSKHLVLLLKEQVKLSLSISFGIFLFMIFYQPFTIENLEYNDWLLFKAGLSAIIFILILFVRVLLPRLLQNDELTSQNNFIKKTNGITLFIVNSVAFTFYLRYLGQAEISLDLMLNVVFISIAPPIIIWLSDMYKNLIRQNEILFSDKKALQKKIESYESDYQNTVIELNSENFKEPLKLSISSIVLLQSADNYVKVVYKEDDTFKKKLLRNTLKNLEQQTRQYSSFIRCHRTCIVNIYNIDRLERDDNKHWFVINNYEERVPVSRQYLSKIKEIY